MKTRYILMNQCALSLVLIIYTRLYFGMLFWDYPAFPWDFFQPRIMIMSQSTAEPKDSKNKHFSSIMIFLWCLESNYVLWLWDSKWLRLILMMSLIWLPVFLYTYIARQLRLRRHWRHLAAQRGRVAKQNKRVMMALVPPKPSQKIGTKTSSVGTLMAYLEITA